MIDGIEIKDNEYNFTKIFINSNTKDNDNTSGTPIVSNITTLPKLAANIFETNSNFDHIYCPYIESKSTQVVI